MLKVFKVVGDSMLPTLKPNDLVITSSFKKMNKRDIVVLNTNIYGNIVKRISIIDSTKINIESDNKKTYSSTCQRSYFVSSIVGKVIFKISARNIFLRLLIN